MVYANYVTTEKKKENKISWNPIKCKWKNDNGFIGLVTFIWLFCLSTNQLGFLPLKCGFPDYNLKIECGKSGAILFPSLGYIQRLGSILGVCMSAFCSFFSLSHSNWSRKPVKAITCSFEWGFP